MSSSVQGHLYSTDSYPGSAWGQNGMAEGEGASTAAGAEPELGPIPHSLRPFMLPSPPSTTGGKDGQSSFLGHTAVFIFREDLVLH